MPLDLGFLQRIINVKWGGGGAFSFAGYNSLNEAVPRGPGLLIDYVLHFTWLGGTSKDGKNWESNQSETGLALFCCVRGKVGERFVTIAVGDVVVGPFDFGPGYVVSYGAVPAAGISHDDGLTWNDAGIPLQQHILKPPNPVTGQGADTATGYCNACAYHPASQTFYVGGSVIFGVGTDDYWEDRVYSGSGAGSFSQVYSERRELVDPFKGYRWPEVEITEDFKPEDRLRVADESKTTEPGDGVLFVVSFGPDQQAEYTNKDGEKSYVSVKENGAGATLGGKDISPPMAVVNSICGGGGHIVAVGWEDEDERVGPVTFVSDDDGATWTEQLSGLKHTSPGPEDQDSGDSRGSCSFSLGTNADL